MYALFNDIEAFDLWHEEIKKILSIPDGFGTTNYTLPSYSASEGSIKVWAYIDDEIDSTGLDLYSKDELIALGHCKEFVLPE